MPPIRTFYDELGVPRDADGSAIKHAFKELSKVYHPDKNPPDKQDWAHEQMSRLNFILETLLNPKTRKEYDEIVRKYESVPATERRRRPREQNAIEQEYAMVSVEIMNLTGKYANCRVKMLLGGGLFVFAVLTRLAAAFTPLGEYISGFQLVFAYFFTIVGAIILAMGLGDYLGRGQYRRRIRELEERRAFLRQRIYEPFSAM